MSASLINIEAPAEDALLLFSPERPPAPRAFDFEPAPRPLSQAYLQKNLRPLARRSVGLGTWLVFASLVIGVVAGFVAGYSSALRNGPPPVVYPPDATSPPRDEPLPVSTASVAAHAPEQGWFERDSGTTLNSSARAEAATRPITSAPSLGSMEVVSRPTGAEVALDGRVVGKTPLSIADLAVGTHVVGIELPGFSRWATSVRVTAGEQARVGASLSPAP